MVTYLRSSTHRPKNLNPGDSITVFSLKTTPHATQTGPKTLNTSVISVTSIFNGEICYSHIVWPMANDRNHSPHGKGARKKLVDELEPPIRTEVTLASGRMDDEQSVSRSGSKSSRKRERLLISQDSTNVNSQAQQDPVRSVNQL